MKTPCRKVCLRLENVQRQKGATDCGLFAVANLVEVLTGGDPRKARFDQGKMRDHLFWCLVEQKFTPFPKQCKDVQRIATRDRIRSFPVCWFVIILIYINKYINTHTHTYLYIHVSIYILPIRTGYINILILVECKNRIPAQSQFNLPCLRCLNIFTESSFTGILCLQTCVGA